MFSVLNSVIRTLYVIDFAVFAVMIALLSALDRKKGLILLATVLFCITWRTRNPIINPRYCVFFIILFLISIPLFVRKTQECFQYGKALCFMIIVIITCINVLMVFLSARNNYIFDLTDDIDVFLSRDKNASILIEEKEFKRIQSERREEKQIILKKLPHNKEDLNEIYYQYEFWNDNAFYIFSEKGTDNLSRNGKRIDCAYNPETLFRKIRKYKTGPNKSFSVYFHEKFYPATYTRLFDHPELSEIVKNGVLKSCSPGFDTFIFQLDNKLYWIIGHNLKPKDEIMYHLYSTRREYLPQRRIQHGNDNRGFYIGTKYEKGLYGHYRLFEQVLPKEYPVSKVVVGLMIDHRITRFKEFMPSKY